VRRKRLVCPSDQVCGDETRGMGFGIVSSRMVGRRISLRRWGSCVVAGCLGGVRASIRCRCRCRGPVCIRVRRGRVGG
jgi:hypothetical protein